MRKTHVLIGLMVGTLLAACSDQGIRHLSSNGDGPDEFRIVPSKPLEAPANYSSLPAPTRPAPAAKLRAGRTDGAR